MASRVVRTIINTAKAPKAIGPYNQAVAVGSTVYLSGQVGIDPGTGTMVEGGIEPEAHQVFKNISEVLTAAGLTFKDVVKCTVLLASMDDYATINKIYGTYFTDKFPARAAYQTAGLPKNARVEIECIAVKGIEDQ
ncbi:2-iminobutanoate/2-iminopropanoate deaminase-like [Apostichopus japonicus]|uniref:2-iminobutanoate/2-iminopropanoate deaminase-like n=1 Tax=Stichopus japonicus TaxID=307972 RepID=UPI003AB4BF70